VGRTCCGVGTKVEEELEEGEARDEGTFAKMVDFTRKDSKEQTRHDEASELEPFTTDDIDGEEGKVVAWQESERSDDDLRVRMNQFQTR
jgi:hypothetical protein